jgi:hypothetical protein
MANKISVQNFTSVTMTIKPVSESWLVPRGPSIATTNALLCQMAVGIDIEVSVLSSLCSRLRDNRLPFINIESLLCCINTRYSKIFLTARFVLLLRMYLKHLTRDATAI